MTHAGQDLPKELDPDAMEEVNILGDDLVEQWNKSQSYGREQADQHSSTSDKSISLSKRVRVLNRRELIALLAGIPIKLNITPQERHNGRVCVGMVGYPNVGKSSVINTLLGVSKSTHGKPSSIARSYEISHTF